MNINKVFKNYQISVTMSGLYPRLIGVGFKRVQKFGFFLGYSFIISEEGMQNNKEHFIKHQEKRNLLKKY